MAPLDPKPPMDSELRSFLSKVSFPAISHVTPEVIQMMRTATATPPSYLDELKSRGISHTEVSIPSEDNSNHSILFSILQLASSPTKLRPCLYWMHGGGFHWGDRLHTLEFATDVILACDAVCISVEYRLAPEFPFSVALGDCYAGLKWISENMQELGIDLKRVMIGGMSAGGGLAASVALLCRERKGPVVCAQCLICPALDGRLDTVSSQQYVENEDFMPAIVMGEVWRSALKGSDAAVLAPGMIEDLADLPTTYLDVGSAEVFRDETVAYASKLWKNGIQAELHVWAGGFHGFDIFLPDAAVSQASRKTKVEWAKRIFEIKSSI